MHQELVERRRWISEKRFLHALNYYMLLPGPEAKQLATYIGWLMHRTWGGKAKIFILLVPDNKREELGLALQEGDMVIVSLMASGNEAATEGFSYWDYEDWMKQQREQALKDALSTPTAMPTIAPTFTPVSVTPVQ